MSGPGLSAPRLCVSALSGGGGKTLLSLGLARALRGRGLTVKTFKKGPDYIDAAWLGLASGLPATNLDPFFLSASALRDLFARSLKAVHAPGRETLALLEGNRGLFDGLDVAGSCSTAELARILACPVLFSLDRTKMTRTAAALVQGLLAFEPGLHFCGVVLNQVGSARHEGIVRRAIEAHTDLPVLGALPRLEGNPLPERHMGIASSGHWLAEDAEARLERMAALMRGHLDLDAVLAAACAAPPLSPDTLETPEPQTRTEVISGTAAAPSDVTPVPPKLCPPVSGAGSEVRPRIGYVRDAAFWFYYAENLQALEDAGAELLELRLVSDDADDGPEQDARWQSLDGLWLGGGFPEDCGPELSRSPRLPLIVRLAQQGLPVYAECGGFMLLSEGIERDKAFWPMCGLFPVRASFCPRPQGLGYLAGRVVADNPFFPVGLELRGHEFHYSRCRWQGEAPAPALALSRGQGMGLMGTPPHKGDGLTRWRVWAAYAHIFAPAVPCWAPNFVSAARQYRKEKELCASR